MTWWVCGAALLDDDGDDDDRDGEAVMEGVEDDEPEDAVGVGVGLDIVNGVEECWEGKLERVWRWTQEASWLLRE